MQYDYTSNSVSVVNGTYAPIKGLKVNARLFNIDSRQVAEQDASLDIDADSAVKALDLPKPANLSTTYFLKLELRDGGGGFPVSDNFYWLSTKPDTMDWANKKDTVYTPQKEFGDLTGLNTLQQVKPRKVEAGKGNLRIRIKNPSSTIAFQVHLRLASSRDNDEYRSHLLGRRLLLPLARRRKVPVRHL